MHHCLWELFQSIKVSAMDSPPLHEFMKQASCFLREKLKSARLILTDVTAAQLMTEEATSNNPRPPDTHVMRVISRAAFEVDDYWRIVEILHQRLLNFERENWRVAYKGLILLDHLLTHGPQRISEDFQCQKEVIKEIARLQYIDERGFNWGLRVRKVAERVLRMLEDEESHRQERARARQVTRGIEGFGSFSNITSLSNACQNDTCNRTYGRCNSDYTGHKSEEDDAQGSAKDIVCYKLLEKAEQASEIVKDDHPFFDNEHLTGTALLDIK